MSDKVSAEVVRWARIHNEDWGSTDVAALCSLAEAVLAGREALNRFLNPRRGIDDTPYQGEGWMAMAAADRERLRSILDTLEATDG